MPKLCISYDIQTLRKLVITFESMKTNKKE